MKAFIKILIGVLILLGALAFVASNYSYVFSKTVFGQVVDVERVTDPTAVYGSRATEAQMYSYSILIQGEDGHLYTASSVDRQWQVVKKGYCVQALLFRYPPWDFERAGTFFNARLKDVKVCAGQTSLPENTTGPQGPPGAGQMPERQAPAVAAPIPPPAPAVPGSH